MPVSLSGSLLITGSITTSGTITAQTLVVQTITASIVQMTGSNTFGSQLTNRQTFTGSMFVTGSTAFFAGNVGIGTTTPAILLQLEPAQTVNSVTSLFTRGNSDPNFRAGFANGIGTTVATEHAKVGMWYGTTGNPVTHIGFLRGNSADSIGMTFNVNNAEYMRVNSSGNVGIGLTNSSAVLHVSGSGSGSLFQISSTVSSSIFFVSGSGNIGIGTTTPTSSLEVQSNQNSQTGIRVKNTTSGTSAGVEFGAYTNSGNGGFGKYSTGNTPYKNISAASTYVYNGASGDIALLNDVAAGNISFAAGSASTAQMFLSASGNVGIGTISPVGKLDVALLNTRRFIVTYDDSIITIKGASDTGAGENLRIIGDNLILNTSSAGSGTERMRITSAGNVGIGTTSPSKLLHVVGDAWINRPSNKVDNNGATEFGSRVEFNNAFTAGASGYTVFSYPSATVFRMYADYDGNLGGLQPDLQLGLGYLTVKSSGGSIGYVGIGTTAPVTNLEVLGSIGATGLRYSSSPTKQGVYLGNSAATPGTTDYATIEMCGGATGGCEIDFTKPSNDFRGRIGYDLTSEYMWFVTNATEKMRITSVGAVLIGRTSTFTTFGDSIGTAIYTDATYIAASATEALGLSRRTSDGNVAIFRRDTTTVGSISVNASATAFNTSSDYRLKQNLKDYNGLSLIDLLKTYDFQWKADSTRSYGVIAHELQEVLPYAVNGEKDAVDNDGNIKPQGVDYSKIVPILVKAIQELKAEIEELKNK
jgi:hypothetical protein